MAGNSWHKNFTCLHRENRQCLGNDISGWILLLAVTLLTIYWNRHLSKKIVKEKKLREIWLVVNKSEKGVWGGSRAIKIEEESIRCIWRNSRNLERKKAWRNLERNLERKEILKERNLERKRWSRKKKERNLERKKERRNLKRNVERKKSRKKDRLI